MSVEPAYTPADVNRARRMARLVIEHFFGSKPARVLHKASGLSNAVFEVHHAKGHFIVRIAPDATRLQAFLKEQWCVDHAREAGVPVAEILEVGQGVIANPYMIQRLEKGQEATHHPERLSTLKELGRIARLINSIETDGFGETFQWSANRLSYNESFDSFLKSEFDVRHRLEVLGKAGMMSAKQAKTVRSSLAELSRGRPKGHLAHGDLRLKNVLVDETGGIRAILDWEHCCSAVAPAWDLAIALHDLAIDGKQAFLEGYGLKPKEIEAHAPAIKALNLLHYAPFVERAQEEKDQDALAGFKVRLSGTLDLYSP